MRPRRTVLLSRRLRQRWLPIIVRIPSSLTMQLCHAIVLTLLACGKCFSCGWHFLASYSPGNSSVVGCCKVWVACVVAPRGAHSWHNRNRVRGEGGNEAALVKAVVGSFHAVMLRLGVVIISARCFVDVVMLSCCGTCASISLHSSSRPKIPIRAAAKHEAAGFGTADICGPLCWGRLCCTPEPSCSRVWLGVVVSMIFSCRQLRRCKMDSPLHCRSHRT